MDLTDFQRGLIVQHHSNPQDALRISKAVGELSSALDTLASMGHLFHLAAGLGVPPAAWPRVLFHATDATEGRVVYTPEEAKALGPGWHEDPAEAHHLAGVAAQFAGRAGRGSLALPMVLGSTPSESQRILDRTQSRADARATLIQQRNDSNGTPSA